MNVLPPTPTVPPTPQQAPPPQEQQQEEAQEEALEESDEEAEETSQEVPEEASLEEELAEGEEQPTEDVITNTEEGLLEEDAQEDRVPAEEAFPQTEEGPPDGDEQAAREAFDTALSAGASPEQAMAEAAATGGFNEPVVRGSALESGPLGELGQRTGDDQMGGLIPGVPVIDQFGGVPSAQIFAPGVGGPILSSPLGPAPMNIGQDSLMIPVFGMGPAFGPAIMDALGGRFENFLQDASGFGGENFGFVDPNPYSLSATVSVESYFFDDPSLYDDYKKQDLEQSVEISSSQTTNTYDGTSSNDNIDKSSETSSVIINGLDGNDILSGGTNNDFLKGGSGDDTLKGGDGDDILIGGIGDDKLTGGNGSDKFYYEPAHVDGTSKDEILDFRLNGNDLIVASEAPTSSFSRSLIHTDSAQIGSTYEVSANGNNLPYVFNFTYDLPTATVESATLLANNFSGFNVTSSGTGLGDISNESMYLAFGDGSDTYIYFWTDTNNHHGMIAATELEPIALLKNFDNDNLNGTEFSFETITGV